MPATTYLPFESAKRRVEEGDFSFEALGALTVAHGEKLVRDYEFNGYRLGDENLDRAKPTFGAPGIAKAWTSEAVAQRAQADKDAWAAEQARRRSRLDPRDPDPTREGIFRDHNCSYCDSGAKPCRQGSPNLCSNPMARND